MELAAGAARLTISDDEIAARVKLGDSVSINGCCLTVVAVDGETLAFDAGEETLSRTNLATLQPGDRVNLETSLKFGDELGGHLVTGHVDAVATVDERQDAAPWCTMWFRPPPALLRQIASKGSVTLDGVSLTVVAVEPDRFSVALIPHTLAATTLGFRTVGSEVNLETDVLAKYVERQLAGTLSHDK